MLAQYDLNRKTLDHFFQSIHPINKRSRGKFSLSLKRNESPLRIIQPISEFSLGNSSTDSPKGQSKAFRELTPIKFRVPRRLRSPVETKWNLMNLQGFGVSLKKRSVTPIRLESKSKKIVTKLPFVKWCK